MPTPHKHAEVIKAWADGAKIQVLGHSGKWVDIPLNQPDWAYCCEYRIKPEPKPDVVFEKDIYMYNNQFGAGDATPPYGNHRGTVKYIIDGETGLLKSATVL